MERLNLSARAYDRILKVARTIADLEGVSLIYKTHISEAIKCKSLEGESWLINFFNRNLPSLNKKVIFIKQKRNSSKTRFLCH